jgi:quinol-cytochrome oxidoreductase complex cytochrome b subunit
VIGRTRAVVLGWIRRFWRDLVGSTDASLLGVLRFLGLLYGRIDGNLPINEAFKKAMRHRLPPHANWRHALGGIAYLLLIILVVTGVLLSFYYRPSAQEAYPSIQYIVTGVTLGWLVRDLHVWGANLLVLAVLAHMARVFFSASYKPPRETNWLIGLLLLFVILAFGATGYLLPWDQWAYWTVTQGLSMVEQVPFIGALAVQLLRGDPIVSGATLSRFFAMHVIVLPWCALTMIVLHFTLVRKHGIAPPVTPPPATQAGVPFFPHHLTRSFAVAMMVLAIAVSLAIVFPREVGPAASPTTVPGTLVSTWIVADASRALVHYAGAWGLIAFMGLGVVLALLPLFDRSPERNLRRRPVVTTLGALFFLAFVLSWAAGRYMRGQPVATAGQPGVHQPAPTDTTPAAAPAPAAQLPVRDTAAGRRGGRR